MRAKRMLMATTAILAMAACGDATGPGNDTADALGPSLAEPQAFTPRAGGGGGPATPATGVTPSCTGDFNLMSIIEEGPGPCDRR